MHIRMDATSKSPCSLSHSLKACARRDVLIRPGTTPRGWGTTDPLARLTLTGWILPSWIGPVGTRYIPGRCMGGYLAVTSTIAPPTRDVMFPAAPSKPQMRWRLRTRALSVVCCPVPWIAYHIHIPLCTPGTTTRTTDHGCVDTAVCKQDHRSCVSTGIFRANDVPAAQTSLVISRCIGGVGSREQGRRGASKPMCPSIDWCDISLPAARPTGGGLGSLSSGHGHPPPAMQAEPGLRAKNQARIFRPAAWLSPMGQRFAWRDLFIPCPLQNPRRRIPREDTPNLPRCRRARGRLTGRIPVIFLPLWDI